ncbi:acyl-CoA dehydrogenase family protein [Streptomyces rapamycinicus]
MIDAFSDEQTEFARLAAKAFAALADGAAAPGDADVAAARATFAEIGLPLLAVPEESGGAGMTEADVVLIVEEAGYADVPVPIAETVGVVAPMVARYGTAEQRERWLPALAAGHSLGATLCPSGGTGTRRGAGLVLVEHEGRIWVSEAGAPATDGVARAGTEPSAEWTGSALGEPEASVPELRTRGAWVTAALLGGVARRLLELSVAQARTREQFGVPIGSFQAVKHMLADMAAALESARPTAWSAARALAAGDPGAAWRPPWRRPWRAGPGRWPMTTRCRSTGAWGSPGSTRCTGGCCTAMSSRAGGGVRPRTRRRSEGSRPGRSPWSRRSSPDGFPLVGSPAGPYFGY